jgi:UDP-N-acetylmuramate: L-alanyl-gamma-D-glutamyl-meso-diaminopimelate ligase
MSAGAAGTIRHVHFVAICGTGMGSLAGLLARRGLEVTGSDENVYPPMSTALARWGIPIAQGFRPENVLARRPDLVVIGNAVRRDNPEARAAIDAGLAVRSFPDALYDLAIRGRHSVVVTGTHGKTTTTSLLASLLLRTGRDPSLLVGGIAGDFDGSFREGAGPHFVVEGDEYDTAFFDKTPKFLHYGAETAVLTSIEFDHADIYRDLDHVIESFRSLVRQLPGSGTLVAALAHANVRRVASEARCRVVGYGVGAGEGIVFHADAIEAGPSGTRFDVIARGARAARALLPLHGRHNVENALAALAALDVLGVPLAESVPALAEFRGVRRRQELRGEIGGVAVIDDFAHHPTAVRETLAATRAAYAGRLLVAVFEPRTNTSRRRVFQKDYVEALAAADRVLVPHVPDAPVYSAFGPVTELFSSEELAADLRARGVAAEALASPDAIVERLLAETRPGEVVLVMSNGAFGGLVEKLLAGLAARRPAPGAPG